MRRLAVVMLAGALAASQSCGFGDAYVKAPAYLKPLHSSTRITPLLTVGQRIPLTGGAGDYLVVGLPDGLGLYRKGDHLILLSNHEFLQAAGLPSGPLAGGARVTEFTLSQRKRGAGAEIVVSSGRPAIERLYEGDTPVAVAPGTRRIAELCSATLGDRRVGFDRPIFMTGEESSGHLTFDGRGGLSFALFEGNAYALPRLGRFEWENRVPVPFTGSKTVVFGLEDGPGVGTGLFSQLYMYVGEKRPGAADALTINGLNSGSLYVFAAADSAIHGEAQFTAKGASLAGRWEPVDWTLDDAALETAAQAVNAFDMVRVEDGAANPRKAGELWFVTTGTPLNAFNPRGRLYRLNFDPKRPTGPATLTLVLDGSEGIVSPDNIDLNRHGELAICEDPNYKLSADLGLARDTYLWIYNIATGALTAVAEVDRPAARAHARGADAGNSSAAEKDWPGGWEISGVVDAEDYLGRGAWILDVQAHSLRIVPVAETVEGGQYLVVVWNPKAAGGSAPTGDSRR